MLDLKKMIDLKVITLEEIIELYRYAFIDNFINSCMNFSNEAKRFRIPLDIEKFESRFCQKIISIPHGKKLCDKAESWFRKYGQLPYKIRGELRNDYIIKKCWLGDMVWATVFGKYKNTIGTNWNSGVVFIKPQTENDWWAVKKKVMKYAGNNIDWADLRKAYFEAPVITLEELEQISQLVSYIFSYLLEIMDLGNKNVNGIQKKILKLARNKKLEQFIYDFHDQISKNIRFIGTPYIAKNKQKSREKFIIDKAIEFTMNNLGKRITLKDVSDAVSLSPFYFHRLFKQETGETWLNYLTRERINLAKKLLEDLNKNINQVGLEVGYSKPGAFAEVFKKWIGITPTEYRSKGFK